MDFVNFNRNGSEYVKSLINKAILDDSRTAVVSGKWIIDSAIRLPSNFTLVLQDCHLVMADNVYDNMFINEHHGTELGKTIDGTDCNVEIVGKGNAVLDGGNYNNLSERNHSSNGLPHVTKNCLIFFTNVDGFKISGISCINQRYWALNFLYSRNGYLGNINFCANDTAISQDGTVYHGLIRSKYADVLVKNADGIDLRQGCHDIVIENVTGFTEDDTIAITGLYGKFEKSYKVEGLIEDIYNVTVKNIKSSAYCTNVRLLNQGGVKLHDVLIDGVYDTSAEDPHLDVGRYAVRVGDVHLYGSRHSTKQETYNITIKNVNSRAEYAIAVAGAITNLVIENVTCRDGCKPLLDNTTE